MLSLLPSISVKRKISIAHLAALLSCVSFLFPNQLLADTCQTQPQVKDELAAEWVKESLGGNVQGMFWGDWLTGFIRKRSRPGQRIRYFEEVYTNRDKLGEFLDKGDVTSAMTIYGNTVLTVQKNYFEGVALQRQLLDPNLTPAQRKKLLKKLEWNHFWLGLYYFGYERYTEEAAEHPGKTYDSLIKEAVFKFNASNPGLSPIKKFVPPETIRGFIRSGKHLNKGIAMRAFSWMIAVREGLGALTAFSRAALSIGGPERNVILKALRDIKIEYNELSSLNPEQKLNAVTKVTTAVYKYVANIATRGIIFNEHYPTLSGLFKEVNKLPAASEFVPKVRNQFVEFMERGEWYAESFLRTALNKPMGDLNTKEGLENWFHARQSYYDYVQEYKKSVNSKNEKPGEQTAQNPSAGESPAVEPSKQETSEVKQVNDKSFIDAFERIFKETGNDNYPQNAPESSRIVMRAGEQITGALFYWWTAPLLAKFVSYVAGFGLGEDMAKSGIASSEPNGNEETIAAVFDTWNALALLGYRAEHGDKEAAAAWQKIKPVIDNPNNLPVVELPPGEMERLLAL